MKTFLGDGFSQGFLIFLAWGDDPIWTTTAHIFFGHGLVKNHQLDLEFSDRDFLSLTIHPMWALRELDGGSVIFKVGFNTTELEVDLKASFLPTGHIYKGIPEKQLATRQ